ncbi:MAG TPA: hypothetical protein VMB72_16675, partial [Acidimicrobiales bacterium]|nr:hypothetical protein [Acidimicrobiales bacterium]
MAEGLSYLGIVVLLVAGSGGWGNAVVRALRRLGWEAAPAVVRPPLQLSLGMALFLAVGGVLVALDLAWFWVLVAWHLIGLALLGRALLDVARRRAWPRLPPLVSSVALGAVAIVVILLSLAYGVTVSVDNMNDDDGAYIYLAQRLLHTGGMIDPF